MKKVKNNIFSKNLKITAVFCLVCAVIFSGSVGNGQNDKDNTIVETKQVTTEDDSGKSTSLENGDIFYLELEESPSTDYLPQLNLS
ncbi:TPA: hypothetical protein HA351_09170 [Methanosarcinaceae archaeon]|nr:hypothetical protein [Methanosarcinaceae archaeon]